MRYTWSAANTATTSGEWACSTSRYWYTASAVPLKSCRFERGSSTLITLPGAFNHGAHAAAIWRMSESGLYCAST